ncbi:MAG: glycoside hydrolase family 3 C-terminal domain-containing protein, partial [Muribaculum sp.]|nr:glycoside hydrolase family 3 C-terminal domain-containing protein [Muribaculum sp.]
DNTVYPTALGLACSFNVDLAEEIARQTACEMRAMNMHWTFSPNVEVARDPRWGRCGETFGEDPYLVSLMGCASIKGYQGVLGEENVIACIKHFVGGSQSVNGTNGAPCDISERTLREIFFPPFNDGVNAGACSAMMSHNELNGIPCHTDRWLMTDVLRGEWDFKGFIVSDWNDIEHVSDLHHTAESEKEAFRQSIEAGMDMHMHGPSWNKAVISLVRENKISEARIDESVRRILEVKFRLGLFEFPFADERKSREVRLCDKHRATALDAARQSIVLLKNHDNLLPLPACKYKHVLVTGINANDENILGDWSANQKPENVITILDGLKQVSPDTSFVFVDQGWDPRNMRPDKIEEVAAEAQKADLNIVVAGEYMMRYRWNDRTCGEDTDRSDIELVGLQTELIKRFAASGKPSILILANGRPLATEWAVNNLDAIIEAWEPGMYGGQAVAEIIYGLTNPSAKLAITIPRNVGQVHAVYNHKPSAFFHPVVVTDYRPLFPFGYGLSYTEFEYSNLKVSKQEIATVDSLTVSVDITNTGKVSGTEIVQMYIRDEISSVTRPVKELKGFKRVHLAPGETKTVHFRIDPTMLSFYDRTFQKIVEPGRFIIMVGASSDDKDLSKVYINVK